MEKPCGQKKKPSFVQNGCIEKYANSWEVNVEVNNKAWNEVHSFVHKNSVACSEKQLLARCLLISKDQFAFILLHCFTY